jgi:hypothetical protein
MRFTGTTFDTTTLIQLTTEGRNFFPTWDPDGQWIVHDLTYAYPESSSVQSIWLLPVDGGTRSKLSTGRFPDRSPNGKNLIFIDRLDKTIGGIIRYEMQTQGHTLLLDANGSDIRLPKYLPEGVKIAFWLNNNLCLTDSLGNNQQQLTTSGVDVSFGLPFSWSPNGDKIIYTRYRSTNWTMKNGVLWLIDVNSRTEIQFAFNP